MDATQIVETRNAVGVTRGCLRVDVIVLPIAIRAVTNHVIPSPATQERTKQTLARAPHALQESINQQQDPPLVAIVVKASIQRLWAQQCAMTAARQLAPWANIAKHAQVRPLQMQPASPAPTAQNVPSSTPPSPLGRIPPSMEAPWAQATPDQHWTRRQLGLQQQAILKVMNG